MSWSEILPPNLLQSAGLVQGLLVLSRSGTLWRILNKELKLSTFGEGSGETSVIMQHQRLLGAV